MNWFERQLERLRSFDPLVVDTVLAALFFVFGIATAFGQDIRNDAGVLDDGFRAPNAWIVLTVLIATAPVAVRRRWPLLAVVVSSAGVLVHILIGWPEGAVPATVLFLAFSLAMWSTQRRALAGLLVVLVTIVVLGLAGAPGLDAVGMLGVIAQFAAVWAIGVAMRNRRAATEARVREAEERSETVRQIAARALAEERLRIAQELHDVIAHSMSVIAVQAGVGAHVLDEHPAQAHAALEAISATSRGALSEMRRLLGVLRDGDGERAHQPAPGLTDVHRLVDDVRAAGVPVELEVRGAGLTVNPAMEASAFRVVQEALTNVIKHAGTTSRVDVRLVHEPGTLMIEVVDDGRGAASVAPIEPGRASDSCHGLVGMRERVELWGGALETGPVIGGGYRVRATLPDGGLS